jgi:5-hydroxyisourate hydrolase
MHNATLSSHVLDLDAGAPAVALQVSLYALDTQDALDSGDQLLASKNTNSDGRASDWPELAMGTYALVFAVGAWYKSRAAACFYPQVRVEFIVDAARHYHVPLLLNRHGYSTYRGS